MLPHLLTVIGGVYDQRVLGQAIAFERGQDITNKGIEDAHQGPVRGAGSQDFLWGDLLDAADAAPPAEIRVQAVGEGFGFPRHGHGAGVAMVILPSRHERLVREHEADRYTKGLGRLPRPAADPEAIQVIDGGGGDF